MDRPVASALAASLLAVLAVAALATAAAESTWFSVHGEGTYTEGIARQPRFDVEYTVDAEMEQLDVHITNATPLLIYWNQRGEVQDSSAAYTADDYDADENGFDLDSAREMMQKFFTAMIIVQALAIGFSRLRRGPVQAVWLLGLIGFLVIVPAGIAASFGLDEPTGGFSDRTESKQFAHFKTENSYHPGFDGLTMQFATGGYDLGLVPLENQSEVLARAPQDGEPFAETYIAFEGMLTLEYADGLLQWCMIPFVWFAVWLVGRVSPSEVDEEE